MRYLLATLALLAPAARAQLLPTVSLGVSGGVNVTDPRGVSDVERLGGSGFHAGVHAEVSAGPLGLRGGLYYLRAETPGTTGRVEMVTIPVDVQLQTATPVLRLYALAGPEVRLLVSEGGRSVDPPSVSVAGSIGAGVKVRLPLVGPSGFVEVRYAFDLTERLRDEGVEVGQPYALDLVLVRAGIGF